ncbi:hypothetical protein GCM10007981_15200 [Thermocladium modestius]|uniref:Uncharacterized protein n=2 Tax=Thermocladium modestius TaxID=62609 RepID=A0A830GVW4_9CREN|nr:hypothetical protein GCM10007981_15200 [Thermocladium modestius]
MMSIIDRLNVLMGILRDVKSSCRDPTLIDEVIEKLMEVERDVSIMADSLMDIYAKSRYSIEKYVGKGSMPNIDQRVAQQILDSIGNGTSLDKLLEGKDEEETQVTIYLLNSMKKAGLVDFNISSSGGKIKINVYKSL